MPRRLKPTNYVVNGDCSKKCSLNPANFSDEQNQMIMGWYQSALNDFKMEDLMEAAGMAVGHGIIGRHRKLHLDETDVVPVDESLGDLSDVEILDVILKKGATQIPNWRITATEWFKALEMKYRLTQGSTSDAMFAAMASAGAEEEDDGEAENRPGGLEESGAGPGSVRESLPLVWPPSGSSSVAEE